HLKLVQGSVDQRFRIGNLINLQTIDFLEAGEWMIKGCLGKLSNLRKLNVSSVSRLQINILLEEIVAKRSLLSSSSSSSIDQYQSPIRSLCISTEEGFPNSIFDSLSSCINLHTLKFNGRLDIVNFQKYPPNLTKLFLSYTCFLDDPVATLQHLPTLRILKLFKLQYEGEEMVCSSKGFPRLQVLFMSRLDVKEWRVEEGGMPHLKDLEIEYCSKLSMLPEGLRFITSLKTLKIIGMPLIEQRIAQGVGEDWYKIQHIPSIFNRRNFSGFFKAS
ncbi:hypothetical protein MKW92_009889, partial [Papaver armeniacum]